jgi:hypothetical protein
MGAVVMTPDRVTRVVSSAACWQTPGGDRVAWFADPDGNTLSLTAFAGR